MPDFYKLNFNSGDLGKQVPTLNPMVVPDLIGLMCGPQSGIPGAEKSTGRGAHGEVVDEPAVALQMATATTEHAARYYAEALLKAQGSERLLAITDPSSPALVPNLRLVQAEGRPSLTGSNVVTFEQRTNEIPVFGAKAVVELDLDANRLLAFDANLAAPPQVSPVAELSVSQAFSALKAFCGAAPVGGPALSDLTSVPSLVYFESEESSEWYLAYHFRNIPLPPPEDPTDLPDDFKDYGFRGCCHAGSPREASPNYDYLVDAHGGKVVYWFSSAPRIDVPVPCSGIDELGTARGFMGLSLGNAFSLHDPLRNISTYDLKLAAIDPNNLPTIPISHVSADFSNINKAAISAHANATLVFDFFNNLLKRQGIDNKGMLLRSVVNAVESAGQYAWPNAAWWLGHMWYGQVSNGNGGFDSYSRYLDIIGHELTHGVTENEANLVYAHLHGALNESFSDIFGVMINNWDPAKGFRPLQGWQWEIGPGLGRQGGPIRNFSNPAATGQPVHFSQYRPLPNTPAGDHGGVHYYSGIHNLAAYKVLTGTDPNSGRPILSPEEVAILYYLTLTKLTQRSVFSDCRRVLLNVAGTYFSGNPNRRTEATSLIIAAYDSVGIV